MPSRRPGIKLAIVRNISRRAGMAFIIIQFSCERMTQTVTQCAMRTRAFARDHSHASCSFFHFCDCHFHCPAHAFEASCDFRKCMSICRREYEAGCAGMCGRIISLCRRLMLKQATLSRGAKRLRRNSSRKGKQIDSDALARNFKVRVN